MEHSLYLKGLKKALKNSGVNYGELARELRMTESGVKKMLNAKDISLRRILQICDLLELTPGQLFTLSEKTSIAEVALTVDQEDALLKNRELLAVYWLVTVEKENPARLSQRLTLNAKEIESLLQKLTSLKLLRHHRGTYRASHRGKFRWQDSSRLTMALNREWSELTLRRALGEKGFHRLVATKLSAPSQEDLKRRLHELLEEVARTSEREELTLRSDQLKNTTTLVALVPRGIFDET